jgi:pimeloyl-ACP methyl ester carboxylesterase
MRNLCLFSFSIPLGIIMILLCTSCSYDRYASRRALIEYPPPGRFATVNGARMHYLDEGSGEPALVFESGFDGGAQDFLPILSKLALHHRVLAFDRLGQDWSDGAPQPRSFGTAADELHLALESLGVNRPVVVGHSLGGALAQVYAARYEVAGLVLVEGLTSGVVDTVAKRLGAYQPLAPLARLGLLRPLGMIGTHPAYAPELRKRMQALRSRSSALLQLIDEGEGAAASAPAELRAAEAALHAPLLVISAESSDVPNLPKGAFTRAEKALADRIENSRYVVIPGSRSHYVMADHPEAVAEAIDGWLGTLE